MTAKATRRATRNERDLIDKLLVKRPSTRMWLQPALDRGLDGQQASDLIDWVRAGCKGKAPDLG